MTDIALFKVVIGGFIGAPGVNTLAFRSTATLSGDFFAETGLLLESVYSDLMELGAPLVSWELDSAVRVVDDATGDLVGVGSVPSWRVVAAGQSGYGNLSRASQLKLRFNTSEIVRNRMLRGGIYFGPINENCFEDNGRINPGVPLMVAEAFGGVTDIAGDTQLAVWSRPDENGANGTSGLVDSVTCSLTPAVLRSRRD